MKKLLTKGQLSVLIVFGILIIDQIIKILVKTNMYWHESIRITDWFYIYLPRIVVWLSVWKYSPTVPDLVPHCCSHGHWLVSVQVREARHEDRIYRLCVFGLDGSLGKHCRQCVLWRAVQRKHPFADSLLHA